MCLVGKQFGLRQGDDTVSLEGAVRFYNVELPGQFITHYDLANILELRSMLNY